MADSTKLYTAESLESREALQRDHDKLEGWAISNCMKFNKSKCHILHLGQNNPGYMCRVGDEKLESSPTEKDLEALADGKLNLSQQCALVAQRANRT